MTNPNTPAPAHEAVLTGDEVRKAVAFARSMTAPSDVTQPGEYVLAGALALLSKLRAPVFGLQLYPATPEPDVPHPGEQEHSYSRSAVETAMRAAHDRGYSVGWDHGKNHVGAPVAEPETMEEIHRRERERAPFVLPKDPTLPASTPVADERAAFEADWRGATDLAKDPLTGAFTHPDTQKRLAGWLSRAALASAPVVKPWPVEEQPDGTVTTVDPADMASAPVAGEAQQVIHQHGFAADNQRLRTINESLDKQLEEVMTERDEYHNMADKLANAIADHLLVEIGEHSSSNCPWMRALEAIENAAPQAGEAVRDAGIAAPEQERT